MTTDSIHCLHKWAAIVTDTPWLLDQNKSGLNSTIKTKLKITSVKILDFAHSISPHDVKSMVWDASQSSVNLLLFQAVQQLTYQAEKKRAIVQQTIWIADNVATCINVHTIDLHIY